MRITLKYRKLGREQADGLYADGVVTLDPRCKNRQRLHVAIHEALHHAFPDLTEEAIVRGARDAGLILWADGWRRRAE